MTRNAAQRVAVRYLKKRAVQTHLPDPEKLDADDAIYMADDLAEEVEDRIRDIDQEIRDLGKRYQLAMRAKGNKDWEVLWRMDLLNDKEKDFLELVHALYQWN